MWFTCALFIASIAPSWALAQSKDGSWSEPLNLSRSGVAVNPAFVIDSEGVQHVIWQDDLGNYVYTGFDGDQWSVPETTSLSSLFRLPAPGAPPDPFQLANHNGPNPFLIAGLDRFIFAVWITPQGEVFTSSVTNQNIKNSTKWDSGRLMTLGATSFAAAVDASGDLHLAFIRVADDPENPPGIYYMRSKNIDQNWTKPVLLYESPYYRTLGEGEAHLSIATLGTEESPSVYIVWDNRPRKQVFMAQSANGGESWDEPVLVAGPTPSSGLAGPFNIHVGTYRNSVVRVWQSGQIGGICSQIYQSSNDAGATWGDPQPMIDDMVGCAQSNEFVAGLANSPESRPLYLLTEAPSNVFLTAWNGLQWSEQQAQPILSGFEDPEIFTQIDYGCQQSSLFGERLYIVGCDQGGGGEIWVTSRTLESKTSLFSSPGWSQPSLVTDDNLKLEAVELVSTDDGLIHAFFSQHQDSAIYYSYWNGELWSRITTALELPEGEAGRPAIATGPKNELFLFAPNDKGALYFSRVTSGSAIAASSWSTPIELGIGQDVDIGLVDVAWNATGSVYVTYSVPVNEERGIYLVQSKDNGTTWSEPLKVFNGATAGFALVGGPSLLISANGYLHIIWKQQAIQGNGIPQPLSLYYTRSEDGGRTFSDAELVVDEPVAWEEIVADSKGNLHLFWQPQNMLTTVWDQVSSDGGRSWQFPQGLPGEGMTVSVMEDSVGRLHVVDAGVGSLAHWLWDGSRWQPEASLHYILAPQQEVPVDLLASAVNKQGKIVVVWALPNSGGNAAESVLLYSTRTLKLPPILQTATQKSPTQTLLPSTYPPATPTPELSKTPTNMVDIEPTNSQNETNDNETNGLPSPFALALLPVALLLLGVLGFVIRRAARLNIP